ncbi:Rho termination factor [Microbacterium mangrovi]|uniref:Rho termination factor n=1 Tax=Microbacterium mangrovi TaxID=1348253 RepID=A0A0B2A0H5_9MICO|nr:Rho termination factor N-terminal domain-containing protein [Microbacterium mangrovi]KHK96516.1 Rho termination factor [Microbacterium mangrovi]
MPGRRGSNSIKDEEMYESMRREGASKEKAARVSNAAARDGRSKVGRRGGDAENLDERTVPELRSRAKELGINGYSGKNKGQLIDLIRNH